MMTAGRSKSGSDDYLVLRHRMVEEQIERRGIKDPRVLSSLRKVERHRFVPAAGQFKAYEDHPLPIGYGQTISQPYIVAYMTDALKLNDSDRVLEIGTGSGYQTAVLAECVQHVYSIENVSALALAAKHLLTDWGYQNIDIKIGDGFSGWPEQAPFDAILVAAAPLEIPPALLMQLKDGGRMIIPLGDEEQQLVLVTKAGQNIKRQNVLPVRFVPMV
jgi:protein-L-isoaspartate(D-aspartate) O-methyltransferase